MGGLVGLLMIFVFAILIGLAISIVICLLLYFPLRDIPQQYRVMEPMAVFLLIIPFFGLVWNFFVCQRIPDSYRNAFHAYGRTNVGDCGRGLGLAYAIVAATAIIPCLNYVTGPAALVLFIIFVVKMWTLKSELQHLIAHPLTPQTSMPHVPNMERPDAEY